MYVILAYDVAVKRVSKMRKTVLKYLRPVQKSVFEGFLTQKNYHHLQDEIRRIVDPEKDAVIFYIMDSPGNVAKAVLGKNERISDTIY